MMEWIPSRCTVHRHLTTTGKHEKKQRATGRGNIARYEDNERRNENYYDTQKQWCPLLNRMQLVCTATTVGENVQTLSNVWVCHCLTQAEVKFTHSSTTYKNICIISDAQNTTALQPNVFLTRIHCLLVTNTGRSPFPCAKSTANSTITIYTKNAGSCRNETS